MSRGRNSATSQESVQNAIKDLTRFLKKLDTIPIEELEKAAVDIKTKAISQTPYKTGKLEKSVYVIVSKNKQKPGLRAGASALSSSGYNYAGIQHENESFEHPIKGKAYFISDPFREGTEKLKRKLHERLGIKK